MRQRTNTLAPQRLARFLVIGYALILGSCTSPYTLAQRQLAAGDFVGAEQTLVGQSGARAESLRQQIHIEAEKAQIKTELTDASTSMTSSAYEAAVTDYTKVLAHGEALTAQQQAQAADGLCTAEQRIGEPVYSLETQYTDCLSASANSGSSSASSVDRLAGLLRTRYRNAITTAILWKNDGKASDYLDKYKELPGADSSRVKNWEALINKIKVDRSQQGREGNTGQLAETSQTKEAIASLERRHPEVSGISRQSFEDDTLKKYVVDSAPVFIDAHIDRNTLTVLTPTSSVGNYDVSHSSLDELNDRFVAWCRCNGKTEVMGDHSGSRVRVATVRLNIRDQRSYVTPGP